jgi:hypothetical protein
MTFPTHPDYDLFVTRWTQMNDVLQGEAWIKSKGVVYLPYSEGMILDGVTSSNDLGAKNYAAYKLRARFPDLTEPAASAMVGIIHRESPNITLPTQLEPVLKNLSKEKENLPTFMKRISYDQVTKGRYGVLVDVAEGGTGENLPYLVSFPAEKIINWETKIGEDGRDEVLFVIIDESGYVLNPYTYTWTYKEKYRAFELLQGVYTSRSIGERGDTIPGTLKVPTYRGRTMKKVPFTFIGSRDLTVAPDQIPLQALSNQVLLIYRGEADYRQNLYLQSQDTLVTIGQLIATKEEEEAGGEKKAVRVGAGSHFGLEEGGDAKYIGVSSTGLPEQRRALENDYQRAGEMGAKLLLQKGQPRESGDALRIRLSAQTATLTSVAQTSVAGIEQSFKFMAEWMGEDSDKVSLIPNLDFAQSSMETAARTILTLAQAARDGAPISRESIHERMRELDLTNKEFAEEMKLVMAEIEERREAAASIGREDQETDDGREGRGEDE